MATSIKLIVAVLAACAAMLTGGVGAHAASQNSWGVASMEEPGHGRGLLTRFMNVQARREARQARREARRGDEDAGADAPSPMGGPMGDVTGKMGGDMPMPVAATPMSVEATMEETMPEMPAAAPGPAGGDCAGASSILDVAMGAGDLSTLTDIFEVSGLAEVLADPEAELTVLAPDDSAFAAIPAADLEALMASPKALAEILKLHILPGVYKAADFAGVAEVETVAGYKLAITMDGGSVTFTATDGGTSATVSEADLMACKGVVHKLDGVMVPGVPGAMPTGMMPAAGPAATPLMGPLARAMPVKGPAGAPAQGPVAPMEGDCDSILDVAMGSADLSTITSAFEATGLDEVLADPEVELTVLAPADSAFAAIPAADLEGLMASPKALAEILKVHVLPGVYKAADFEGVEEVETVGGYKLGVAMDGGSVTFTATGGGTSATVSEADLMACKGVVHKLDGVIIPAVPAEDMMTAAGPAETPY